MVTFAVCGTREREWDGVGWGGTGWNGATYPPHNANGVRTSEMQQSASVRCLKREMVG